MWFWSLSEQRRPAYIDPSIYADARTVERVWTSAAMVQFHSIACQEMSAGGDSVAAAGTDISTRRRLRCNPTPGSQQVTWPPGRWCAALFVFGCSCYWGWDSLGKIGFEYSAAEIFEYSNNIRMLSITLHGTNKSFVEGSMWLRHSYSHRTIWYSNSCHKFIGIGVKVSTIYVLAYLALLSTAAWLAFWGSMSTMVHKQV